MREMEPKTLEDLLAKNGNGEYIWPDRRALCAAQSAGEDLCAVCACCGNLNTDRKCRCETGQMNQTERNYRESKNWDNLKISISDLCAGFVIRNNGSVNNYDR